MTRRHWRMVIILTIETVAVVGCNNSGNPVGCDTVRCQRDAAGVEYCCTYFKDTDIVKSGDARCFEDNKPAKSATPGCCGEDTPSPKVKSINLNPPVKTCADCHQKNKVKPP
jgi:hypothetical protein